MNKKILIWVLVMISLLSVAFAIQWTDLFFYQGDDLSSLSNDVVLNMPFSSNSNSTFTQDLSKFGNNGVVTSAVFNSSDNSYRFDGSGDKITTPLTSPDFPATVGVTFTYFGSANSEYIISRRNSVPAASSWNIQIYPIGSKLRIVDGGGDDRELNLPAVVQNVSHTIIINFINSTSMIPYYDGVEYPVVNLAVGWNSTSTQPVVIGNRDGGTSSLTFNGSIKQVLIFNRSLTASEVSKLYQYTRTGKPYFGSKGQMVAPQVLQQSVDNLFYKSTGNEVYSSDLVGYYTFDGTSNATFTPDTSGKGNNGTVVGAVQSSAGIVGNAYNFSGLSNYITLANKFSTSNTDFSVYMWVNTSSSSNQDFVLADGASGGFIKRTTNYYSWVFDSTNRNAIPVNFGVFQFVGCSYYNNITYLICYSDGIQTYSNSVGSAIRNISTISTTGATDSWNGTIDEVMIFNRTLSASEVYDLYSRQRNVTQLYFGSKDYLVNPPVQYSTQRSKGYFNYGYDGVTNYNINTPDVVFNMPVRTYSTNQTSVRDYSVYGNNGTFSGYSFNNGANTKVILNASGANFNQSASYFSYSPINVNVTTFTINFRFTDLNSTMNSMLVTGIGAGDAYLRCRSDGKISLKISNTTASDCGDFIDSVDTSCKTPNSNYTLVANGTSACAYKNGILTSCGNYANSNCVFPTTTRFQIGAYNNGGRADDFNGSISHIQIFNKNLNATEVSQLYNCTSGSNKYSCISDGLVFQNVYTDNSTYNSTTVFDVNHIVQGNKVSETAIRFNGTQQVLMPVFTNSSSVTLSAWIKPNVVTGKFNRIAGVLNNIIFRVENDGRALCYTSTGSLLYSTSTVPANNWTFYTCTITPTESKIYFNGVYQANGTSAGYNLSNLYLGAIGNGDNTQSMNGTIDNVLIFNRSLSANEIAQLYAEGR